MITLKFDLSLLSSIHYADALSYYTILEFEIAPTSTSSNSVIFWPILVFFFFNLIYKKFFPTVIYIEKKRKLKLFKNYRGRAGWSRGDFKF